MRLAKGEGVWVQSEGNEIRASEGPIPVASLRKLSALPAVTCGNTCGKSFLRGSHWTL